MDHKIRHRFKRMWQPSMEHCQHCGKSIGLSGAWCTECKWVLGRSKRNLTDFTLRRTIRIGRFFRFRIRVHSSCKDLIGENCGWTTAQMRQIYEHFINNRGQFLIWPFRFKVSEIFCVLGAHKRSPTSYGLSSDTSPYSMSSSYSIGHLSAYGPDSASSSSCNSSAPSTPAPGYLQPSPSLTSTSKSKFTFPGTFIDDVGEKKIEFELFSRYRSTERSAPTLHSRRWVGFEVKFAKKKIASCFQKQVKFVFFSELRMSQSSGDATIHSSHEGSVVGLTTSDNKLSPADNDVTNSVDSNDSNQSQTEHKWSRHLW